MENAGEKDFRNPIGLNEEQEYYSKDFILQAAYEGIYTGMSDDLFHFVTIGLHGDYQDDPDLLAVNLLLNLKYLNVLEKGRTPHREVAKQYFQELLAVDREYYTLRSYIVLLCYYLVIDTYVHENESRGILEEIKTKFPYEMVTEHISALINHTYSSTEDDLSAAALQEYREYHRVLSRLMFDNCYERYSDYISSIIVIFELLSNAFYIE